MNRLHLFLIIALSLILPQTASAAMTGSIWDYNALVFGDFNSTGSDIQGRLAVKGNAELKSYHVGDGLSADNTGNVLTVGKNLTANNVQVDNGNVSVGGTANLSGFSVPNGTLSENTASDIDFDAYEAYSTTLSTYLAGQDASGTSVYQYGGLYLEGADVDMLVFNINGNDLANSSGLYLTNVGDNTSTIIINVSGTDDSLTNMGLQDLTAYNDKIIFNFFEAESLYLSGVTVQGSVLAPNADATGAGGSIYGNLIASSFDSSIELEYNFFKGETPTINAVPEPSSMLLLGFGLIGMVGVVRFRRA